MKKFLPQRPTVIFVFFFLIISLGLSAQVNPRTRLALSDTRDTTCVSIKIDKKLKEDYPRFNKIETAICDVNIDGVSYFKSGDNMYYAIDLKADSPKMRFRRWSRKTIGNIG